MKTSNVLALTLLLVATAGCASSKVITGPDGTPHQLISCNSIENCYDEATKICGKYKIVNSTTESYQDGPGTELLVKCEQE